MNKKFLSAILFGALMVTSTGTFVSCKDYDDDIENLQTQINSLATKSDVEAKLSQLQTAIDAAKAEAIAAAKAADESAEIAALEAEIAALETCKCDVDAMLAEIQAAVDADMAEYKDEINALIEKAEKLVGEVADYVTSVELVASFSNETAVVTARTLSLMTAIEKDNVFGKDLPGEITFVKGTQRQTGASFVVRVSPTNAVLTPEMVSLVDGEGNTLDDFLTVSKVERYSKQILGGEATAQTRANGNSGLWTVTVELKNYDKDSFNAATLVENSASSTGYNYKKFAVEINNTLSTAAAREVVSTFDLQIAKKDYVAANELNYWVNTKNVTAIRNRYATSETGVSTGKEELKWINGAATAAARNNDGTLKTGTGANAVQASATPNDNRSSVSYIYPAVQGKSFTISLDNASNTVYNNMVAPSEIRAMYVTLDTRNAVESSPSEINAWNSYTYTGLDQVVEGKSVNVTIDGTNIINDIIGLRVYAVNVDGTLVDPDGRAFYVRLGAAAANWSAVNTTIIPDANDATAATAEKSDKVAATLSNLTGAVSATWTTTKIGNNAHVFDAYFIDADGNLLYSTTTASVNTFPAEFKKVAKIYTVPTIANWYEYEDGKTFEGKLTIKNANDFVLATLDVTMTKTLPGIPAGYSMKTGQKNEAGIYNCYLTPDNWVAPNAANGEMIMSHVFNWGEDNQADQYVVSFAASQWNGSAHVAKTAAGDATYTVGKDYIDNKTEHATVVSYNYGPISSAQYEAHLADPTNVSANYVVKVDEFPTVYNCIYNTTYSWDWATIEEMAVEHEGDWAKKNDDGTYKYSVPATSFKYGEVYKFKTPAGAEFGFDQAIQGVSTRDGRYSAMLYDPYLSSLKYVEGHVITKANSEVDEYFKVAGAAGTLYFEPTQVSTNTNPTTEVPSTLQLKYKDMYNHDVVIELDVTVLPR